MCIHLHSTGMCAHLIKNYIHYCLSEMILSEAIVPTVLFTLLILDGPRNHIHTTYLYVRTCISLTITDLKIKASQM